MKGLYDNILPCRAQKNKANSKPNSYGTRDFDLKRKYKTPTPATTIAVIERVGA
jgi:hypothetical protein